MLRITVREDDTEVLVQALNDAMDKLEVHTMVFASSIEETETSEPENAAEMGAL